MGAAQALSADRDNLNSNLVTKTNVFEAEIFDVLRREIAPQLQPGERP